MMYQKLCFLTFVATFLCSLPLTSAPGSLDTTFSGDGKVTLSNTAAVVAIQDDQKIVVGGWGLGNNVSVSRYTSAGVLDLSFGTGGMVNTGIGSGSDSYIKGIVIQPDGKIVAAGYASDTGVYKFAVLRYTTAGVLDTTNFNQGGFPPGYVLTPIGTNSYCYSVVLQDDGKILVAGRSDGDFTVARYNSDGSLDTTGFGSPNGYVIQNIGTSDIAYGVAVQADGKIVVAGVSDGDLFVARYTSDGSLDTTFDSDGTVTTDFSPYTVAQSGKVLIQADGKIVVGLRLATGLRWHLAVVRYNSDGSLDTFGFNAPDGYNVLTSISSGFYADSFLIDSVLQQDGKIIVPSNIVVSPQKFVFARYNTDGTLDTIFGSPNGYVTTDDVNAITSSCAIQADGKIVVTGYRLLARYHADPAYIGSMVAISRLDADV